MMMLPSLQQVARALGGEVRGNEVLAPAPNHSAADRSLSVKIGAHFPDGLLVHTFAGDDPIAAKDYVRLKCGMAAFGSRQAKPQPKPEPKPQPQPAKAPAVTYFDYHGQDGAVLFRAVRTDLPDGSKTFSIEQADGLGGFIKGFGHATRVLYRLPDVLEAVAIDRPIFVAEGEKVCDALARLGLVATTNPCGAGKWLDIHSKALEGANVIILPDNDKVGADHAAQVAKSLEGVAARVRVLALPDLPQKGDAVDWIAKGGTVEKLWELVEATAEGAPKPPSRIKLIPFGEIVFDGSAPEWRIEGITPIEGIGVSWGPPQSYKSFLELDMGLHIATGRKYRGRDVKQGPVVYCAFEGGKGLFKRVEAWRRHYEIDAGAHVPFYLQAMRLELVKDVGELIDAINATLGDDAPAKITLDTLNRSITGSESSDADMGAYFAAADKLREAFKCYVGMIHHPGWNTDRLRGHSSLQGNIDVEIAIKSPAKLHSTLEVKKMKDEETGVTLHHRLEKVEIGTAWDGSSITSLVAIEGEEIAGASKDMTPNEKTMYRVLFDAHKPLTVKQWNEAAKEAGLGLGRHATLYDLRKSLVDKKLVTVLGDECRINHEGK